MANEFLSPYAASKYLEGVIEALPKIRGTLFQDTLVPGYITRETRSVNLDEEFAVKNTTAMFVDAKADVTPVQLGDFGTKELYFAYTKEGWGDDEFDVLDQRQLGDQFGQVNVLANKARRLVEKAAIAEQRIQNLFEKTLSHMALYGKYEAFSQKHPKVWYDFGRNVTTTGAALLASNSIVSQVNLTTSAVTAPWDSSITTHPVLATAGSYTSGEKAWTKTLVTAGTATPVKDLTKIYESAKRWGGAPAYFMIQDSAYEAFNFDISENYAVQADKTMSSLVNVTLDPGFIPKNIDGLTLRRYWDFGNGDIIPIYSYNAVLNNRITGAEEAIVPDGFVLAVPSSQHGLKIYGRIKHPRANYSAMPRFINRWMDEKTAVEEYELHCNFLIAHRKINSVISWKVV